MRVTRWWITRASCRIIALPVFRDRPPTRTHLAACSALLLTNLSLSVAPPPRLCPVEMALARAPRQGKQLSASKIKSRIFPGTFSDPKLLWQESKDKYTVGVPYREIFSEKKKGFLTGDYPRRDEFANTIRTEQVREVLKRETRGQRADKKKRERDISQVGTAISTASTILQTYSPVKLPAPPLYDVVMRIPEPSLKLMRDDRQAKLWYMQERSKLVEAQKMTTAGSVDMTAAQPPIAQWFNMKIDGRLVDVLVDESGQVVSQRPHLGGTH